MIIRYAMVRMEGAAKRIAPRVEIAGLAAQRWQMQGMDVKRGR
ncbi:hypothetical protein [Candidatus Agathobaculum pullicola]